MSAEIRFTRWVVPERGRPAMMIGRGSASSRISGWRLTQVLEPQAVREHAHAVAEHGGAPERTELGVLVRRREPDAQARAEVLVAEVVEAGLPASGGEDRVLAQRDRRLPRRRDGRPLRIAQLRRGEIVDADVVGARGRHGR